MATRWGIVSAGKISHDFALALRTLPATEHQIVAVAARNVKSAQEFADRLGIPKAYGSYEELAKDKDVEIAYVGVIHPHHLEVSKLMLNSGKHVLVEKPMCMNVKETRELIEVARKKKLFLMEAVWSRFFPSYKQLKEEIAKNTIGEVLHVSVHHGFSGAEAARVQKKNLGGSAILDIGIYMINAMCFVYGEKPQKITSVAKLNEEGVDQNVAASFLFSGGRLGSGSLSSLAELPNELVVTGTKGHIKLSSPYHAATEIVTPERTYQYPLPDTVIPCNFINSAGLRYEAERIRQCLQEGLTECPEMTLRDSEVLAEIMETLIKQSEAQ